MAKDMTLLWGSGSPPCWRLMIALEEKNLQGYNSTMLSFEKMEHKSEVVMKMNPRGQLPSFKHGSNLLNESYAACMYLESQFKSQGNKLIPDCPAEQAMMYQRMFEGLTLTQKMADVIYYTWKVPEEERHDSAVKRNKENLSTELKLWEGYLKKVNERKIHVDPKNFPSTVLLLLLLLLYMDILASPTIRLSSCHFEASAFTNCFKSKTQCIKKATESFNTVFGSLFPFFS
ncbi:glutathione S-transferase A isoform X1 [Hippoglossus hippoglossus]|uniref:glutathione S-transferase A isoform X1 n=1 Tax=Hippoglossus hippoglossus TaxID=8267 RepID=UPI00148DB9B8|nr:glutathione S-transferase A isoform X1 [Hippoglossus hippoglossus]